MVRDGGLGREWRGRRGERLSVKEEGRGGGGSELGSDLDPYPTK